MEFLDKLVIPQPGYNLELLNYLMMIALAIFLNYTGLLFGSNLLSLIFKPSSTDNNKNKYLISYQYAELMTRERSYVFGLGVVPFLSIIMIYTQLLHELQVSVVGWLIASLVIYFFAVILIYSYKRSFQLSILFSGFNKQLSKEERIVQEEYDKFFEANSRVNNNNGVIGFVLLLISMWMFVGTTSYAVSQELWSGNAFFNIMFSVDSIIKFLHFFTAAIGIAAIANLFINNVWEKDKVPGDEEYLKFANKTSLKVGFIFTLFQPLFFLFNLLTTPDYALNNFVFAVFFIALFLVFILIHFLYSIYRDSKFKNAQIAFYLFIVVFAFIGIKEKSSFSVTNEAHRAVLDKKYKEHKKEMLAAMGRGGEEISGEEIYNTCKACHKDENTPAAPAHKNVIPKYEGDKDALVQYILNPYKVDPNYPAMPSQGLKPAEAQAVADYLLSKHTETATEANSGEVKKEEHSGTEH